MLNINLKNGLIALGVIVVGGVAAYFAKDHISFGNKTTTATVGDVATPAPATDAPAA